MSAYEITYILKQPDGNAVKVFGHTPYNWTVLLAHSLEKPMMPSTYKDNITRTILTLNDRMAVANISSCDPNDAPFMPHPVVIDFQENTIEDLMGEEFSSAMTIENFISKYTQLREYSGTYGVQGVQGVWAVQGPAGSAWYPWGAVGAVGTTGPTTI